MKKSEKSKQAFEKNFLLFLPLLLFFMVGSWTAELSAQDGTVRVTAARANIRAEAKDTAPVLLQVTAKTILTLKAVEGEWFRIQVPPDPKLGGMRIEAYISKKVAAVVTPVGPASAKAAEVVAPLPEPAGTRDGMSVGIVRGNTMTFLDSSDAKLRIVPAKTDSLRALAAALPKEDEPFDRDAPTPMVYAWAVDGATSGMTVAEKRPALIVMFKSPKGLNAAEITPLLVKLTPTISGARLIALIKARADQAARTAADWDVAKDLKQDVVRTTVELPEPGAAQLTPMADLAPGEYAVVFRPNGKKKLSGAAVLAIGPETTLFTAAWTFSVK